MNIGNSFKAASNVVTSKAGLTLLKGRKHSPHIMFVAGVVGFGATVVMASKATLKLDEVLSEHEFQMTRANRARELYRMDEAEPRYSEKDLKKDQATLKIQFVKDLTKLYGPTLLVGGATLACFTGSHVTLNRRYTGALAAYATLDTAFREYRERVAELAPDLDQKKLMNGVSAREVVDAETGAVETAYESEGRSPYARLWSRETTQSWDSRPELNLIFLKANQNWANDMLKAKGYLFLSDVYKQLGLEPTKESLVTGWVKGNGDDYVDFGFLDADLNDFHGFMTGREGAIWLDFNVDGVIWNMIGKGNR